MLFRLSGMVFSLSHCNVSGEISMPIVRIISRWLSLISINDMSFESCTFNIYLVVYCYISFRLSVDFEHCSS
jgi:hypothetical protein